MDATTGGHMTNNTGVGDDNKMRCSRPTAQSFLPLTQYEVLLQVQGFISEFLSKDIEVIRSGALEGPFLDEEEFPCAYMDYLSRSCARFAKAVLTDAARSQGLIKIPSEWLEALQQSEEMARFQVAEKYRYFSALNFELYGKKTFFVTDNLVDRLAMTELDAPADCIRLPFTSCMFVYTGRELCDAIAAMCNAPTPHYDVPVTVYLTERPFRGMRKLFVVAIQETTTRSYGLFKRELLVHPEWAIDDLIRTDWNKLYAEHPDWDPAPGVSLAEAVAGSSAFKGYTGEENKFYEEGRPFFRILINSILYLSSSEPDLLQDVIAPAAIRARLNTPLGGAERKKLKKQLHEVSSLPSTVLGAHYGPIIVDKRAHDHGGAAIDAGTLTRRFMVRGHWRHQAHGPHHLLRKLMFIEPFWKGPELGEIIERPYLVK
jgi:hypothetical protein